MTEAEEKLPTVVRNSRGLSINGTRITLYQVMDYVHAGRSPASIQEAMQLTDRQVADVMDYIAAHAAQVEAEYQQVLLEAEESRRYWEERNRERLEQIAARPPRPELVALRARIAAEHSNGSKQ